MCPIPPRDPSTAVDPRRPGRRPASSRSAIEEAAGELFLESTYAGTTIEQITTRAGVSRASFFNYFHAKSDLLWGDVDALIDGVAARLAAQPADVTPLEGVRLTIISLVSEITADAIPLAVTQWELMRARDELLASGLSRFAALAAIVQRHLEARCTGARVVLGSTLGAGAGGADAGGADAVEMRAAAFAIVGAVAAASEQWASGGRDRGSFAGMLDRAISPVCAGFAWTVC